MGEPRHYYNEIEPSAIARLRNLMDAGHIPAGDIDTRSIEDVRPNELAGYVQCHFFAGIGGWPLALAIAGWEPSRPVWSGSCPCQPFSQAGKGAGFDDQRHLWPAFYHLISQCRPAVVFGEQVASKNADPWIDLVHADMENVDYAFGCVPFPAAGIGTPHMRDRNYWVADADHERHAGQRILLRKEEGGWFSSSVLEAARGSAAHRMANSDGGNAGAEREQCGGEQRQQPKNGRVVRLANPNSGKRERIAVMRGNERDRENAGWPQSFGSVASCGQDGSERPGPVNGHWRDADWIACTDGKWRPVEPGTFPLAHGLPIGMGKLSPRLRELAALAGLDARSLKEAKAYRRAELHGQGNAIVPEAAAYFISAYTEARALTLHSVSEAA